MTAFVLPSIGRIQDKANAFVLEQVIIMIRKAIARASRVTNVSFKM
jgi:hypothetical protein